MSVIWSGNPENHMVLPTAAPEEPRTIPSCDRCQRESRDLRDCACCHDDACPECRLTCIVCDLTLCRRDAQEWKFANDRCEACQPAGGSLEAQTLASRIKPEKFPDWSAMAKAVAAVYAELTEALGVEDDFELVMLSKMESSELKRAVRKALRDSR